jgi:hydrogenase-4 membrane subunit HyfE
MAADIISWIAVGLMLVTSTIILINRDWRLSLGALAVQDVAAFWLITRHLPFVMGSAKLITGWMVVAALGMTRLGLPSTEDEKEESTLPRGQWFRVILVCIIALVTFGATPRIESAIPGLGWQVIAGGLILLGAGVVHLGLTSEPLNVIIGLLTMLTGFEILYAAIESSILVSGLLAVISLGLGIVGSYLLIAGSFPIEVEDKG